jgi:hypothetical protein
MRDLAKLIDEMLKLIPEEETTLRRNLEATRTSVYYTAPEAMVNRFWEVSHDLDTYLPYLVEDWEFQIVSMFTEIPEQKLRDAMKDLS